MELLKLGKHCSHPDCKQLDFLPFQCNLCSQQFCVDHHRYADHNCTQMHKLENRVVPVCPLCNSPVAILKGQNPNDVVERHILNGCKKESARTVISITAPPCSFAKCSDRSQANCKFCRKSFCLTHRHERDHKCASFSTSSAPASSGPFKSNGNSPSGFAYRQREAAKLREQLGGTYIRPGKIIHGDDASPTNTIKFSNTKQNPVPGAPGIDPAERFVVAVFFPFEDRVQPTYMCFHRKWALGRVLDLIANIGKIKNVNNKLPMDDPKRLHLFNLATLDRLPNNLSLQELSNSGVFANSKLGFGVPALLLERGESLSGNEAIEQLVRLGVLSPTAKSSSTTTSNFNDSSNNNSRTSITVKG